MRVTLTRAVDRPSAPKLSRARNTAGPLRNTLDAASAHCDRIFMPKAIRLDVQVVPSPLGPITVVERNRAVFAVEFSAASPDDLAARAAERLGAPVELVPRKKLRTAAELTEYFRGARKHFDVGIDLAGIDGFRKRCLTALTRVPFGQLVTYGELATRAGQPKASRAVGGAMARNPIPIIVPCHRVVAADGTLGGFTSGLPIKRRLHAHESIDALEGGWEPSKRRRPTARVSR
jgi:methylated-DNA-[protein]-cysteine S-methyltransferase